MEDILTYYHQVTDYLEMLSQLPTVFKAHSGELLNQGIIIKTLLTSYRKEYKVYQRTGNKKDLEETLPNFEHWLAAVELLVMRPENNAPTFDAFLLKRKLNLLERQLSNGS